MLVTATKYSLSPERICAGTRGSYGVDKLEFAFSPEWDGLTVSVVFYPARGNPVKVPYLGGEIDIPAEVMAYDGAAQYVIAGSIIGDDGKVERQIISLTGYIDVWNTLSPRGGNAKKVTPDTYDLFLSAASRKIVEDVERGLTKAKESGEFDGPKGDRGEMIQSITQRDVEVEGKIKHEIEITTTGDKKHLFYVSDGDKGERGFSPAVTITKITGGHRVSIGREDGTAEEFDIKDGAGIKSTKLNDDYTLTITYENGETYTTPSIRGAKGEAVTIKSITETDEAGGYNVVEFSDGSTLRVKNASDTVCIIPIDDDLTVEKLDPLFNRGKQLILTSSILGFWTLHRAYSGLLYEFIQVQAYGEEDGGGEIEDEFPIRAYTVHHLGNYVTTRWVKAGKTVYSINGMKGDITLGAADVGAATSQQFTELSNAKLDKPDSAAVGQIIAVKAVDEDGKPTAVEAIDMPTGGGSGGITTETDPTVPDWAKQPNKPQYTASEVGALPASTKIPAKTSDLQNNSGFITRLTTDLANYYAKSDTYNRSEIDAKISAIPKFAIAVVSALPTSNISATTVYLVGGGSSGDLYTEYIYANGAWEILGSQRVDLTGYATEEWVIGKLGDYLKSTDLQTAINTALVQAKASGEFDGPKGEKGDTVTINRVTASINSGTGSPSVSASVSGTVQSKDIHFSFYNLEGAAGKTPVKGEDYFTDADIEEIAERAAEKVDVAVDDTLTQAGAAADAAAVGAELGEISKQIAEQQTALNGKLPKNFGADNVGKFLVVGSDGNLVLTDMPEGGASGDVVGVLDESKNILLSGDIAEGTYPLKWLMTDGTYADAGTLTVTLTPEPEVIINWITNSINADGSLFEGGKGYKTNTRLSTSAGTESTTSASGIETTGFIPVKLGDTMYIKGITIAESATNQAMCFYNSSFSPTKTGGANQPANYLGNIFGSVNGELKSVVLTTTNVGNNNFNKDVAYIRICAGEIDENSIITINQPIE